jgi:Spy/CpxP family protein refolding chaperone
MENNNPSRTRHEAAVLVFVVFLLGLLVGGVGSHLWGQRVWGGRQERAGHGGPHSTARIVNEFTRELQLTPDQQTEIGEIIDQTRGQVRALYRPLDAKHEEIRQQGRDRIRAVLTPGQLPKFDAFMQRIDGQRKKDQAQH